MTSKIKILALSSITAAFLVGCGGGGGSSSISSSTTGAGGASQKGPFKSGQTVTAQKLLANGSADGDVTSITITTDSSGKFQFTNIPWSGATEFKVEGEYLNESTGEYVPGGLLTAVVDVQAGTAPTVNLNILTHIAAANIKAQMANNVSISEATETAKEVVQKTFSIDLSDGTDLEDLDITAGDSVANTQLLKLSAALTQTEDPEKALENLAEDLADGEADTEDGTAFDELKDQEALVDLQQVALNLKSGIEEGAASTLGSVKITV